MQPNICQTKYYPFHTHGAGSTDFKIPETNPEDAALFHFTSGTTGMPKAFYMCIMLFLPIT
jgi:acyl-coenzyme A synthetase/AMP-(fatty) acid ligase